MHLGTEFEMPRMDWSCRRDGHVDTRKVVKDSVLLLEELLDWFSSLGLVSKAVLIAFRRREVYVNEGFQVFVQTRKVIFAFLVVRDEPLLSFQQALTLLLQGLTLCQLMVDAGKHQFLLVIICVLGLQFHEFFDRYQGELLIGMATMKTWISTWSR